MLHSLSCLPSEASAKVGAQLKGDKRYETVWRVFFIMRCGVDLICECISFMNASLQIASNALLILYL